MKTWFEKYIINNFAFDTKTIKEFIIMV